MNVVHPRVSLKITGRGFRCLFKFSTTVPRDACGCTAFHEVRVHMLGSTNSIPVGV